MGLSEYAYANQYGGGAPLYDAEGNPLTYEGPEDYVPAEEQKQLFPRGLPVPKQAGGLATRAALSRYADIVNPRPSNQDLQQNVRKAQEPAPQPNMQAPKGGHRLAWDTPDPGAVGEGERAARQSAAYAKLGQIVGTVVRMAA